MVTESFLMSASITAPQLSQMITNQRCFETSATAMVGKHARVRQKNCVSKRSCQYLLDKLGVLMTPCRTGAVDCKFRCPR